MDSATLIDAYFGRIGNQLAIGDIPVSRIVAEFGTPLFIYDQGILHRKFTLLRDALPPEFHIYYSVKANPNQDILRTFLGLGCGLEIASAGEFVQAVAADCPAEKIVFAGPGKTESELEHVLAAEIGEIHAESLLEVQRIASIAHRLGVRARVALRVNPTADAEGGAMRMGGKAAPFGVDEESLDQVLDVLRATANIDFSGLHLFTGTQILDHSILLDQYKHGLKLARRVSSRIGRPLPSLDFGGGLGIPYFAADRPLDLTALKAGLQELCQEVRHDPAFQGTRFVVEPGRFLVGEAGIYVVRVNDVKQSRGKKYLIADGGMHHHLAASGNLGQTIKRNYPVANISRLGPAPEEQVELVGPLCTPLDALGRSLPLPHTEVGDLIAIFQSGAYARAASPLGFLSHPSPAEVFVKEGIARLSRKRGDVRDYMSDQAPAILAANHARPEHNNGSGASSRATAGLSSPAVIEAREVLKTHE